MKTTKIINKEVLIYSDEEYNHAVNYAQWLYNFPITLNYKGKKYIIGAGTKDSITLIKENNEILILTENRNLNYLGLESINLDKQTVNSLVFLESNDIDNQENICFDILNKPLKKQLIILNNYL